MSVSVGELITRYGKVLIAFWVVVACIMISPAIATLQESDITFSSMNDGYTDTQDYIRKYFDDPDFDLSKMQILVINYDSADGYRQLQGDSSLKPYTEYITERFYADETWSERLDGSVKGVTYLTDEGNAEKGMILLGFKFPVTESDDTISGYTGDLRSTIDRMTDDYMYELYEKERHFDVNLTGNCAMSYDSDTHLSAYLLIAVVATLIFTMIIMGIYFGSVLTSIVSTSSTVISAIVTLGLMRILTFYISIPITLQLIALLLSVVISFFHSILIISAFRNRKMLGMDDDEAFIRAQKRSSWIITMTTVGTVLCCIVMMLSGSKVLSTLGIILAVGAVVTAAVSITVPLPMINLTKHRVFWTRTSDGRIKNRWIERISKTFNSGMKKIAETTKHRSRTKTVAVIVIIAALCITSCVYVSNDKENAESYDLMEPFMVDDSKTGLDVMKSYNDGGLTESYDIALEFKEPAAHIERDFKIGGKNVMTLYWYSDTQYKEVKSLEDRLYSENKGNISTIGTVVKWGTLVSAAVEAGHHDSAEIIEYICAKMAEKDWTAGIALQWEIKELSEYFTEDYIVNSCGPRIDYVVNESLGSIGYHMNSQKTIVVDRFLLRVYTAANVSSVDAMRTTDNINRNVSSFVDSAEDITGYRATGLSAVCSDMVNELSSKFVVALIVICILILVAFAIIERNIEFTLANFIPSIVGMMFSFMIISLLIKLFSMGSMSFLLMLSIPLICITTSAWFGCIQYSAWRKTDNIGEVLRLTNPIITVSTAVLLIFCIILAISDIRFIGQLALSFAVITVVEGFFIKVLITPSLWSMLSIGSMKNKE